MKSNFSRGIAGSVLAVLLAACTSKGSNSAPSQTVSPAIREAAAEAKAKTAEAEAKVAEAKAAAAKANGNAGTTTATAAPVPTSDVKNTGPSNTPAGKIAWAKCTDDSLPGLECATLALPIDPADPKGKTFDMALSRRPADDAAIASIVVNPGGPGASGLGYALSVSNSLSEAVLAKYDIIGFDPRGVGKSMPIDCVNDAWLDTYAITDPTPDTPAELTAAVEGDLGEACAKVYPDQTAFSTVRVAADLESLRIALDDETLNFYGASYGSYLGAAYATLYPNNIGRLVLDAAFVPEKDGYTATVVQQKGFNKAFSNWVAWCNTETKCAFNNGDVLARWNSLVDKLEAKPLAVGKREVGEGAITAATYASLYSRSQWGIFAAALLRAEEGDGSGLLAIFDGFYGRDPSTGKWDNLPEANSVIACASGITRSIDENVPELVAELKAAGPLGRFVTADGFTEPCDLAPINVTYAGPTNIVIVGSQNDPATPYSQAIELEKRMGPNSKLITFTGEGHGGVSASQCSADAVSAYFDAGTPPKAGLTCGPNEKAESKDLSALKLSKVFIESSFEEGGSILGLDSATFATKTYVADKDTAAALIKELDQSMTAQGYKKANTEKIPSLTDTFVVSYENAGGNRLIAFVIGSKGFASKDLLSLKPLVGADQSMIIMASPVAPI